MLCGEESSEPPRGGGGNQFGNLPFATYRTLCVRLCDGYYFPVSFSTLPNHFQRDSELCASQCAAPADLFGFEGRGRLAAGARADLVWLELAPSLVSGADTVSKCGWTPYDGWRLPCRVRATWTGGRRVHDGRDGAVTA